MAVAASAQTTTPTTPTLEAAQPAAPAEGAPAAAPAQPAAPAPAAAAPAAPPPPPLPFEEAFLAAANNLLTKAKLPEGTDKVPLVIDPLVDGVAGMESMATQEVGKKLVALIEKDYPRFEVLPFSAGSLAQSPVVLIGTFTPINQAGQAGGPKDVYRICLALADLKSGTKVSAGVARAKPQGIDVTPTSYASESPVWLKDPAMDAYIKVCQGTKVGDPVAPEYVNQVQAGALISDATEAYDAGRYEEALDLYTKALAAPGGDQLRAYNGIYLANWKLGRTDAAAEAFGKAVDYGLKQQKLAVKFLFRVGSTQFYPDPELTKPYDMWLDQIASHAAAQNACLDLVGHTSPTGTEAFNDRLSMQRADQIKSLLVADAPTLGDKLDASGVGWRETLIGTGKDDLSDALDRRVEFKIGANC
jgi:outer membrane protein OmpA-like peptidoglycan-associated protein